MLYIPVGLLVVLMKVDFQFGIKHALVVFGILRTMVTMYALPWAFLAFVGLSTVNAQVITDDTYFYGQSPPVYPSRK